MLHSVFNHSNTSDGAVDTDITFSLSFALGKKFGSERGTLRWFQYFKIPIDRLGEAERERRCLKNVGRTQIVQI